MLPVVKHEVQNLPEPQVKSFWEKASAAFQIQDRTSMPKNGDISGVVGSLEVWVTHADNFAMMCVSQAQVAMHS
jgi:hypothetical protein